MIKTFKHKGLQKFYKSGSKKGINPEHTERLRIILARLDASQSEKDMSLPGLRLHSLSGNKKGLWAVNVSGDWRVIFRFEGNNVVDVDYNDYH